jgi:4-hydroxy-tetrahydrodipicolinate reductase
MHSIRGGTIVGEHEVLFAGPDECISLKHTASSKRVFAEGSVNAAIFLVGKAPKLYDMTDLLDEA